jgi:hypothetical protein
VSVHEIPLLDETLHGFLSTSLSPVLTIDPGDSVRFQALNAGWHWEFEGLFSERDEELHSGHALTGPIEVRARRSSSGSTRSHRGTGGLRSRTARAFAGGSRATPQRTSAARPSRSRRSSA